MLRKQGCGTLYLWDSSRISVGSKQWQKQGVFVVLGKAYFWGAMEGKQCSQLPRPASLSLSLSLSLHLPMPPPLLPWILILACKSSKEALPFKGTLSYPGHTPYWRLDGSKYCVRTADPDCSLIAMPAPAPTSSAYRSVAIYSPSQQLP